MYSFCISFHSCFLFTSNKIFLIVQYELFLHDSAQGKIKPYYISSTIVQIVTFQFFNGSTSYDTKYDLAQSAGATEYTGCISAEG